MPKEQGIVKKVLMYENRKIDPMVLDASTPELEQKAFLKLFNYLDENWEVYAGLKELKEPKKPSLTQEQIASLPEGELKRVALAEHERYPDVYREYKKEERQKSLYALAKSGDAVAAKRLLESRRDYEYEIWNILNVH